MIQNNLNIENKVLILCITVHLTEILVRVVFIVDS